MSIMHRCRTCWFKLFEIISLKDDMFDGLTNHFTTISNKFRGKKKISQSDIDETLRAIRKALLEADCALETVNAIIDNVREKASGQTLISKDITADQQIIKIVHDCLLDILGGEDTSWEDSFHSIKQKPKIILFVGLQGSGKTTSVGKIAYMMRQKSNKENKNIKILLASLDIYRPAAQEQLAILAKDAHVDSVDIITDDTPNAITKRALKQAKDQHYDYLILDTAGRTHIDQDMMNEVIDIHHIAKPDDIIFVADALTGQDALQSVKSFHAALPLTAIALTRIDGDQRGGAALSLRHVTGCPIRFMGVGEKLEQLEIFHPERVAQRILGMGDIVSLVEKASDIIDEKQAEEMSKKMMSGGFDFNDMLKQMDMLDNMGGLSSLMGMMPGLGKLGQMKKQIDNADNSKIKRQRALIQSMTYYERANPHIIHASRKKRITNGAGTSMSDLNKLIKQYEQMKKMMKKLNAHGGGDLNSMSNMLSDNGLPNLGDGMNSLGNNLPFGNLPPFKK